MTGGNGMLGTVLVRTLLGRGNEVVVASRHATTEGFPEGVRATSLDLTSGEGLVPALQGVDTVVHAASSPMADTQAIDVAGTRRLTVAAAEAGVTHLVYVSIVGVDAIPYSYYRAKFAAEQVVATGRVPWTVQRITQFHPFVSYLFDKATAGPVTPVPADTPLQPISLADAAQCLADDVQAGPVGYAPDRGGPRVEQAAELARQWRDTNKPGGRVVGIPVPGKLGRALRAGAATCPSGASGGAGFADSLIQGAT